MEFEDKLRYDAKVGAAAADREEEIWVRCGAGGDDGVRCRDYSSLGIKAQYGRFERLVSGIPARGCR